MGFFAAGAPARSCGAAGETPGRPWDGSPPGTHLATPDLIEFTPLRGTPARPFGSHWQIIICNNARREEVCDVSPYFFLCAFLVDMASACIIR